MPTIVGVGAQATGAAAVVTLYPAGYTAVADDIALTFIECDGADVITPPTNWAILAQSTVTTGTATMLTCIWRRLTAGEAAPTVADAGNHMMTRMIIIRGCVTTGNPWEIANTSTELVADTSVSIASGGSTAGPNRLCLAAFATGQDIASTAGATGWADATLTAVTEQMDNWTSAGLGGGLAMATGEKATAGAVGPMTATLSLTANFKAQMYIALREQAGGGGGADEAHPLARSPRPSEQPNVAGPYAMPATSSTIFQGG